MSIIYEHPFTFDVPDWAMDNDGWTLDCGGKRDYDPTLVHFSCRVYPDHTYICSLYLGEKIIVETGIERADNAQQARRAVEDWCAEKAAVVIAALSAAGMGTQP